MKKIIFLIPLLALSISNSFAVSLQEALSSGYNNHEEFKVIRTDFIDSLEAFPKALSSFIPQITGDLNYQKNNNKKHNAEPTNPFDSQRRTESSNFRRSVTIQQSVFEGFGGIASLSAAQSIFRASRAEFYANEQNTMLKAIEYYVNFVEALEKYNIATVTVESSKTQLEALQEKFNVGEATETELASTRQAMASAEAQQAAALSNYESAKAEFIRVFGVEPKNAVMPQIPQDLPKSLEELNAMAMAANPSLEAAKHKVAKFKSEETKAKAALFPRVNLQLQADHSYPKNSNTQTSNSYNYTSAISVSVPILSKGGAEYSDIRHARNQKRKSAIELDLIHKKLQSNSQAIWLGFKASTTRVNAAMEAVRAAEIAYDGMVQEEILGSKTILDVLQAQERLNKARQDEVAAQKDLILISYQMKSLTGHLTAKALKLPVQYFEPEKEFKKIKTKIIGF